MIRILTKAIDTVRLLSLQGRQKLDVLVLTGIVPALGSTLAKVTVSNLGHFYAYFATGKFSTLGAGPADDGISHLSGKLIDGGTARPIFNDFVPLDLWLTPGRAKDALAPAGAASNNLFVPIPFHG